VSDRIITLRLRRGRENLTIIGVYTPTIGNQKETESFYIQLHDVIDKLNKNHRVIISGDLNARIGTETMDG
jgi:exonuclease III